MNKLLKAVVGLANTMREWLEEHGNADGWLEHMYSDCLVDLFEENEPLRYGFDFQAAYGAEMARLYHLYKCPVCESVFEYGGKNCSCECDDGDIDLSDDEAEEWWIEFVSDTGTIDEVIALGVLRDDGYPKFIERFDLDQFISDAEMSLQNYEFIETAEDAMVWFLAAAHLHHYSGFHLERLDGWREEDCYQVCDDGLLKFFGRDVIDEFTEKFDLKNLEMSAWELEEEEEREEIEMEANYGAW